MQTASVEMSRALFYTFFFGFLYCVPCAAEETGQSPIEFFIGGKRYGSVQEYKREKLKGLLREIFPSLENSQHQEASETIFQTIGEDFKEGDMEELQLIIEEFQRRKLKKSSDKAADSAVMQMQAMIEEFRRTHPEAAIDFHPDKIKTIIISPEAQVDEMSPGYDDSEQKNTP